MEILLDHGASPNPKDRNGDTPLKLALDNGKEEAANLLKQRGAAI